jgi:hypothetical protein
MLERGSLSQQESTAVSWQATMQLISSPLHLKTNAFMRYATTIEVMFIHLTPMCLDIER